MLDTVVSEDVREAASGNGAAGEYYFLSTPSFSLAVPQQRYAEIDRWEFGGHLFLKIAKKGRRSVGTKPLDVIAVLPKPAPGAPIGSFAYLADHAVTTFWYSPSAGVAAFAFVGKGSASEVYYCAEAKCLFASAAPKP